MDEHELIIEREELIFKLKLRDIPHDMINRNVNEMEVDFIVHLNKVIT